MTADFTAAVALDRIRDGERIDLAASDDDRAAIARRLGLVEIERFEAHCILEHDRTAIRARGRIKAAITQSCIASGEPVPAYVDEPFELRFQPPPDTAPDAEIELSGDELDVVFHDGQMIELGAAIADTLGLSVDPYPRGTNADAALHAAGVISEEQAGPFAALAALKGKTGEE